MREDTSGWAHFPPVFYEGETDENGAHTAVSSTVSCISGSGDWNGAFTRWAKHPDIRLSSEEVEYEDEDGQIVKRSAGWIIGDDYWGYAASYTTLPQSRGLTAPPFNRLNTGGVNELRYVPEYCAVHNVWVPTKTNLYASAIDRDEFGRPISLNSRAELRSDELQKVAVAYISDPNNVDYRLHGYWSSDSCGDNIHGGNGYHP